MPKRVEPKSEVVFRVAKPRERPYLLADGNGLALRVWPNGSKTWLLRYRRPSTGKENFLSLGPTLRLRSSRRASLPRSREASFERVPIRSSIADAETAARKTGRPGTLPTAKVQRVSDHLDLIRQYAT